jgi:hypothetical protein
VRLIASGTHLKAKPFNPHILLWRWFGFSVSFAFRLHFARFPGQRSTFRAWYVNVVIATWEIAHSLSAVFLREEDILGRLDLNLFLLERSQDTASTTRKSRLLITHDGEVRAMNCCILSMD